MKEQSDIKEVIDSLNKNRTLLKDLLDLVVEDILTKEEKQKFNELLKKEKFDKAKKYFAECKNKKIEFLKSKIKRKQ